jgi:hypothetical protein
VEVTLFVFIVEISKLLKTGQAVASPILSADDRDQMQDASGAHRIGP